jgi:hypothetical protein
MKSVQGLSSKKISPIQSTTTNPLQAQENSSLPSSPSVTLRTVKPEFNPKTKLELDEYRQANRKKRRKISFSEKWNSVDPDLSKEKGAFASVFLFLFRKERFFCLILTFSRVLSRSKNTISPA